MPDVDISHEIHSSLGLDQYTAHYSRLVQLALSGARGDQSPRLIFHSRQPAEAHTKFPSHPPGRELRQNRGFFISFLERLF